MPRPQKTAPSDLGRDARFDDAAIARAVLAMPRHLTHSQVAARLATIYGAARAWSADMVRQHALLHGWPPGRGHVEKNVQLRRFVDDRIGRMSLEAIFSAVQRRFGDGVLSRSSLHRYLQRERDRQAREASEVTT